MVRFGYESFDWHHYLVMLAEPVDLVRGQRVIIDIVHFQFLAAVPSPAAPLMLSAGKNDAVNSLCRWICQPLNLPLNLLDVQLPCGDCLGLRVAIRWPRSSVGSGPLALADACSPIVSNCCS